MEETVDSIVPADRIERKILVFRGFRVMLDSDLADLYGVSTKRLNEQVKRNLERFPSDFMFRLTTDEMKRLRSQIATSKKGRGGRQYLPYVFTEHGAVMMANVLKSPVAVQASIQVVRAFINLRQMLSTNKDLELRLDALERLYDSQFAAVFQAIRDLMGTTGKDSEQIGFSVRSEE